MMAQTTFVLFAQDVLALSAAQFGLLTTSGRWAVWPGTGCLAGDEAEPRATLYLAMVVFGVTQLIIGCSRHDPGRTVW